jgi:thiol-disulfide isomerase/thioredoxin
MKLFQYITLFLIISFNGWSQPDISKVKLEGFSPKEGFNIYYNHQYGEKTNPISFTKFKEQYIFIDMPTMFYKADLSNIPFFIIPGEHIIIHKTGKYFSAQIPGNQIRNNEQNLLLQLVLKYGPIDGLNSADNEILLKRKDAASKKISALYSLYEMRSAFIDSFMSIYPISAFFEEYIKNYFFYSYLDCSINSYKEMNESIWTNKKLIESLGKINFGSEDSILLYIDKYRTFIYDYNQLLSKSINGECSFLTLMRTAISVFKGRSEDYLLFVITKQAIDRSMDSAQIILNEFNNNCKKTTYVEIIRKEAALKSLDHYVFDKEILDEEINKKSLFDVIQKTQRKFIYIDFWASWCIPCMNEMPLLNKLQQKYMNNNAIGFLYISLDKSNTEWSVGKFRAGGIMTKDNSYLLLNGFKSKLATSFNIKSIPKYIIVNDRGKILDGDAPLPSDPKLTNLIEKVLNN